MNFERGQDPLDEIGIGRVANAPLILNVEYMRGDSGGMWYDRLLDSDVEELLGILCTTTLDVHHYYPRIAEYHFIVDRVHKDMRIWDLPGKIVKHKKRVYHIKEDLKF